MADQTTILSLPLIQPAQAQKHVTHNEALRVLDAVVQLAVADRTRTDPPVSPTTGDRHIVKSPATGDWAGHAGDLAVWSGVAWEFHQPLAGWQAWVVDETQIVVWNGTAWVAQSGPSALEADTLGLNATANATNRLTVSAPATLLNHDGAGHQVKINKASASDTASLLFQSGFSGRAEMGLAGDNNFAVKVSDDGSAFATAMSVAAATGIASFPEGLRFAPGTVTSPGLAASNDTDCGLFRPATNALGLAAGGVEGARVTANGLDAPNLTRGGSQVYSRDNVIGILGQSGGQPTGALFEQGTTADGSFVKLADGTLICIKTNLSVANASTTLGGLYRSADLGWTYPAAFIAAPVVSGAVDDGECWLAAFAVGASACTLRALAATSKASSLGVRAMAVGRWF